ncbi:hypothetical protein D3H64_04455 [Atopobacter sp. AH10]|uniref:hypothetical protein n=1 Tax=Atopobacter sp. AH10 TaxID=2315861 RepID=UPI000EF26EBF|nr:hypothetical protein [Atopobacter sp. AH10]RLK63488.1 hypothetical protein D3H64_04455 [Atopobacter sp. AH10]
MKEVNKPQTVWKDWLVRYHGLLSIRYSKKQMERAIHSLVKDISQYRQDVRVKAFSRGSTDLGQFILVGKVDQADRIICSYYDTPMRHFGSYVFFDHQGQQKKTLALTCLSSALVFLLGMPLILAYRHLLSHGTQAYWTNLLLILMAFLYFFTLGKVAKGLPRKKNGVRNTSSLLAMLRLIATDQSRDKAYIFFPNGSYGDYSLKVIEGLIKEKAELICLDSIGSGQNLYFFSKKSYPRGKNIEVVPTKERISYLISARSTEGKFYLRPEDLNDVMVNEERIHTVCDFLRRK